MAGERSRRSRGQRLRCRRPREQHSGGALLCQQPDRHRIFRRSRQGRAAVQRRQLLWNFHGEYSASPSDKSQRGCPLTISASFLAEQPSLRGAGCASRPRDAYDEARSACHACTTGKICAPESTAYCTIWSKKSGVHPHVLAESEMSRVEKKRHLPPQRVWTIRIFTAAGFYRTGSM